MVNFHHQSVLNQPHAQLRAYERLLTNTSLAKIRQVSSDSIKRLEDMITLQERRVERIRHRSVGSRSQTLRVRASVNEVLVMSRLTLQQIKHSTENLEISWGMLD